MPNIPGIEYCIDSNGFFELKSQPKKVAVIGGGYIGVELVGVFHALGSDTKLFLRGEKPLRGFDDLLVDTLIKEMGKQKMDLVTQTSPTEVEKKNDGTLILKTDKGNFGPFDQILFATGRTPLIDGLGLEHVPGLTINKKNMIEVDDFQQTGAKGVYAVGDVSSKFSSHPQRLAAEGGLLIDFSTRSQRAKRTTTMFQQWCLVIHVSARSVSQRRRQRRSTEMKMYGSTQAPSRTCGTAPGKWNPTKSPKWP